MNHEVSAAIYFDDSLDEAYETTEIELAMHADDESLIRESIACLGIKWEKVIEALKESETKQLPYGAEDRNRALCAGLGQSVSVTFSELIWNAIQFNSEQARGQRKLQRAAKTVHELERQHGRDDPRTVAAMAAVLELMDPGFVEQAMAECGIVLPDPVGYDGADKPVYELSAVAEALGAETEELVVLARDLDIQAVAIDTIRPIH